MSTGSRKEPTATLFLKEARERGERRPVIRRTGRESPSCLSESKKERGQFSFTMRGKGERKVRASLLIRVEKELRGNPPS